MKNWSWEKFQKFVITHEKSFIALAFVVVFFTVYALLLPASTLVKEKADSTPGIVLSGDGEGAASRSAAADEDEDGGAEDRRWQFEEQLDDKIQIQVAAPDGGLPEGVELKVEEVELGNDLESAILAAAIQEAGAEEDRVRVVKAMDISFWEEDTEVEPTEEIQVAFSSDSFSSLQAPVVVHLLQEEPDEDGNYEVEVLVPIDKEDLDEEDQELEGVVFYRPVNEEAIKVSEEDLEEIVESAEAEEDESRPSEESVAEEAAADPAADAAVSAADGGAASGGDGGASSGTGGGAAESSADASNINIEESAVAAENADAAMSGNGDGSTGSESTGSSASASENASGSESASGAAGASASESSENSNTESADASDSGTSGADSANAGSDASGDGTSAPASGSTDSSDSGSNAGSADNADRSSPSSTSDSKTESGSGSGGPADASSSDSGNSGSSGSGSENSSSSSDNSSSSSSDSGSGSSSSDSGSGSDNSGSSSHSASGEGSSSSSASSDSGSSGSKPESGSSSSDNSGSGSDSGSGSGSGSSSDSGSSENSSSSSDNSSSGSDSGSGSSSSDSSNGSDNGGSRSNSASGDSGSSSSASSDSGSSGSKPESGSGSSGKSGSGSDSDSASGSGSSDSGSGSSNSDKSSSPSSNSASSDSGSSSSVSGGSSPSGSKPESGSGSSGNSSSGSGSDSSSDKSSSGSGSNSGSSDSGSSSSSASGDSSLSGSKSESGSGSNSGAGSSSNSSSSDKSGSGSENGTASGSGSSNSGAGSSSDNSGSGNGSNSSSGSGNSSSSSSDNSSAGASNSGSGNSGSSDSSSGSDHSGSSSNSSSSDSGSSSSASGDSSPSGGKPESGSGSNSGSSSSSDSSSSRSNGGSASGSSNSSDESSSGSRSTDSGSSSSNGSGSSGSDSASSDNSGGSDSNSSSSSSSSASSSTDAGNASSGSSSASDNSGAGGSSSTSSARRSSRDRRSRRTEDLREIRFNASQFSVYCLVETETVVRNIEVGAKESYTLTAEGDGYFVKLRYTSKAAIPEGAELVVSEIGEGTEEYEEYYAQAQAQVLATASNVQKQVSSARFFDITIYDAEGEKIEPKAPVEVQIFYDDSFGGENEDINAIHFGEDKTEVIESEIRASSREDEDGEEYLPEDEEEDVYDRDDREAASGSGEAEDGAASYTEASSADVSVEEDAVTFVSDSFSVYGIVVTTIEKTVLASDGKNYKVTVDCGPDSGIPEGAELEVVEILPGENGDASTSLVYGKSYEEYVTYTENALGWEAGSASYARVFDISIVKDGKKVQPAEGKTVDVKIELADVNDGEKLNVVHFADEANAGDVVESATNEQAVSFEADSFSAYAIVKGPDAIPKGFHKISSITELLALGSKGLYIGHTDGYYYGNTLVNDGSRIGIKKTKPAQSYPDLDSGAAKYYFEQVEGTEDRVYAYCYAADGTKQYVYNGGDNSLSFAADEGDKTAFTVTQNSNGSFKLHNGAWYWNMQGGANGDRFCSYNNAKDGNNDVYIWSYDEVTGDPYDLDGKTHGLMNWSGGVTGRAMMGTSGNAGSLDAMALTVMAKQSNNGDKLFVPNNSDITMWTFHWDPDDNYHLSAVVDGSTKYLKIASGRLEMVSDIADATEIQVVPGSGTHAGEICLKSGDTTLTYSGAVENGFSTNGSAGSEWLDLVDISELTAEYFMTYSASKVSVSDASVTNGSRIIVYTRSWNDQEKKYEFYAIGHDGSLVRCYENGDSIQWLGSRLNTLLWNFVEYYWEGTNEPNYYYELYNQYSEKYIAPQISGGQILSGDTIGINMNGRRNGRYYSPIVAWDNESYAYAGLKVENGKVAACPFDEADDFYFAVMQDIPVDDTLTTVPTIDHTQYGITMKIVDFGGKTSSHDGGSTSTEVQYEVIGDGSYTQNSPKSGLLSTNLGENNYPTAVKTGKSLAELFGNAQKVNNLFIESTYSASGYYEFDSTQNFASLDTSTGKFKVYKEIGTMDGENKNSLKHGQFMPFNDLEAGVFASVNRKNLYSAALRGLPNSDPRKYEQMYLVRQPDYYFGVEIEAAFTQTPSGLDDWGHDIIYEFTGDDDFWLYVDGELVIDLGGIHSALPGSVNYSTGDVNVNGTKTTLRELFERNYRVRNPEASPEAVAEYLGKYFDEGKTIFKDYSTHTMKIFYMERGAGASNLYMRFNLASVKPGTVQLSKALSGVDATESVLAEFPYQILYTREGEPGHYLTNQSPNPSETENYVYYKGSKKPVKYESEVKIGGVEYGNVFFLKPGEIAEISFPEGMEKYKIVECGVDTAVYEKVMVNGEEVTVSEETDGRGNFGIDYASTEERATVTYMNNVNPNALRTLSITKQLFKEDGKTPIEAGEDSTTFSFRLYLATEFDNNLDDAAASMYVYHVKDPHGNYCVWDASQQKFVALEGGKTNYEKLTDEDKKAVSQRTSTYGSISQIPAGYTVEVRNLLAGTQFKVVERPAEIPDGYSFQKYLYKKDYRDTDTDVTAKLDALAGVSGTIVAGQDPHVDVCNLKGWGLRVNKVWSDADYMSDRDASYFAVFTRDDDNKLTLVNQSNIVRRLAYGQTTLYWYFLPLPVPDVPFDRYEIREVMLENPKVDGDGNVTEYDKITVLKDGGELELGGRQKGETTQAEFTYTVQYPKREQETDSNVRVDMVTNDRPGLILKKQDWSGQPLAGATFTLETEGTTVGTFTSDANGLITTAFLSNEKEYVLTETASPQGYHGLEKPMTIRLNGREVSVSGPDGVYYSLTLAEETTLGTLTVKNRPFTFRAVQKDGDTDAAMAGVEFALHRQVTVDGVTAIDPNPMPDYESLKTDGNGVVPKIDEKLPAGTYELREGETLDGYEKLSSHIPFTVSPTGEIILGTVPEGVELTGKSNDEGVLEYVLTIPNYKEHRVFTFAKAWRVAAGDTKISWPDESITVNILRGKGESGTDPGFYAAYTITQSDVGTLGKEIEATKDGDSDVTLPKLKVIGNSDGIYTFQLEDLPATGSENGNTVKYVYYVSEPEAVAGFQIAKYFKGEEQAMGASRIENGGIICNDQIDSVLPSTGGRGTRPLYLLGTLLLALAAAGFALRKRRRA